MRRAALLCAAVIAGGCAPIGAVGSAPRASTAARVATAETTHEYPAAAPPAQRAPGHATPEQAVLAFATAYINWRAATVTADMRALAAASVGQARAAMQLAAAQTAGDYELHRGGIANSGAVVAIAPLRGRPNRYVVVTRESTTASRTAAYEGLRPAWHVTVATVRLLGAAGWVLSGWQPES